jgi:hypothetical protein
MTVRSGDGGPVTVKVAAAVWRQLDKQENSLSILVQTKAPRDQAEQALTDVVAQMGSSTSEVDEAASLSVQSTSKGPALFVRDLVPYDAQRVLERVGELLAERGIENVTFTTMPTVQAGGKNWRLSVWFKAVMQFSGHRPPGWQPLGWKDVNWVVADEDQRAGVDYLTEWALRVPGSGVVASIASEVGTPYVEVPLAEFPAAVRKAALRTGHRQDCLASVQTAEGRSRRLHIVGHEGMAAASEGHLDGSEFDWRTDIAELLALLSGAGHWFSWAHVVRASGGGIYVDNAENPGRAANTTMWVGKPYEMQDLPGMGKVYDAFGIMLMHADVAQRLRLDPLWSTQTVANDAVLATHVDLAGWYAHHRIDDHFIDQARAQLGDAVIDRYPEVHLDV